MKVFNTQLISYLLTVYLYFYTFKKSITVMHSKVGPTSREFPSRFPASFVIKNGVITTSLSKLS